MFKCGILNIGRIKSVPWEYSCDEEYLEKINKGNKLEYSLLQAILPQRRLSPGGLYLSKSSKQSTL